MQRLNFWTKWGTGEELHFTHLSNDSIESRWIQWIRIRFNLSIQIRFHHIWFSEGRRHGKTVIFAKNIVNKRAEDDDKFEDSDYDESDTDESMSDGHTSKKQKLS